MPGSWSRLDSGSDSTSETEVPRTALGTMFRNQTVKEIALDVLCIAHAGLQRRAKCDSVGLDETHFLRPLFKSPIRHHAR